MISDADNNLNCRGPRMKQRVHLVPESPRGSIQVRVCKDCGGLIDAGAFDNAPGHSYETCDTIALFLPRDRDVNGYGGGCDCEDAHG